MIKKRRRYTAAYKFRVLLGEVEDSRTINQLSSDHEVHTVLIRAGPIQSDGAPFPISWPSHWG